MFPLCVVEGMLRFVMAFNHSVAYSSQSCGGYEVADRLVVLVKGTEILPSAAPENEDQNSKCCELHT